MSAIHTGRASGVAPAAPAPGTGVRSPGWRRALARLCVVALTLLVASAHVGTLDAFFVGAAGPYRVQVTVRPPGVVPGLAQVVVRVDGGGATRVTTRAAQWNVGTRGAPPPDDAVRVPGDSALWSSELWLMTRGSYAVHVGVEGAAGAGQVVVPVSNVATQRLEMSPFLGWILAALGVFLALGFVSLVGASVRESVVLPGDAPSPAHRRRARIAMAIAAAVFTLVLTGGRAWWNAVDAANRRQLFRPMQGAATVHTDAGRRMIRLAITDSNYLQKRVSPLIPDHGKLVHLFLVGSDGARPLAHLHPVPTDSATFESLAGALPGGHYRFYADVVHESGFAETMTGELELPGVPAGDPALTDRDDAWYDGLITSGTNQRFADGTTVEWLRPDAVRAGNDVLLRFNVRDAGGAIASLDPYMGMPAHAMVARDDGGVFAHLHGNGSFSMAAHAALAAVERGDTVASRRPGVPVPRLDAGDAPHNGLHLTAEGRLEFPFAFPSPGRYTIWVQFRRTGTIRTAAFSLGVL